MLVVKIEIKLDAPWVQSLKEKRTVVKRVCSKLRNQYNLSVAEIGEQDTHKTTILGLAFVATDTSHGDSIADHILQSLEQITECEFFVLSREFV